MKIVVFGNTNNCPLLLTLQLRKMGMDAELIINSKELLHRPENKIPENADTYPTWIHDYSHLDEKDYLYRSKKIRPLINLLKKSDYLIMNQLGPSLLTWVSRPSIAFLTGSDLEYYARYSTVNLLEYNSEKLFLGKINIWLTKFLWWNLIRRQRKGITLCKAISFFPRGVVPHCDEILDELGIDESQRFHIYMGDVDNIDYHPPASNHDQVRIFCGARLTWKKPALPGTSELDYKGIDILLHGLKLYLTQGGAPVQLRLVKKGWHITETINLAKQLDIEQYIVFLDEMSLYEFNNELIDADICVDSLSKSAIGMNGLDAMSTGRPLIANARHDVYSDLISDTNPVCHASTPQEVADQLHRLVPNFDKRKEIGRLSREFVIKYWSPAINVRTCLARLGIKQSLTN